MSKKGGVATSEVAPEVRMTCVFVWENIPLE